MTRYLTVDQVREELRALAIKSDPDALAQRCETSRRFLDLVIMGRRQVHPKMLKMLGLTRRVVYVKRGR